MLHPQLINSLSKTFPYKCEDLEYILENTSNIKVIGICFVFECLNVKLLFNFKGIEYLIRSNC